MDNKPISNEIKIIKKSDTINTMKYNYLFKIALIGDSGIGKSSILIRFTTNNFQEDTQSTIGVDFKIVSVSLDENTHAKMQIWDTCGSERFKSLTSSFIKSCQTFLLVFDITKYKSFKSLENWLEIINENTSPKLLCLIGNKTDLEEKRQVPKSEAIQFALKHNLKYLETSAKTNEKIEDVFIYVAKSLYTDAENFAKLSSSPRNTKGDKSNLGRDKNNTFEIGGFKSIMNVNNNAEVEKVEKEKRNCC
jgi:small GTP-binding protein